MNVNRLYRVQIYICSDIVFKTLDGIVIPGPEGVYEKYVRGIPVKETIVYHTKSDRYIDFETKEKYKLGINGVLKMGDMYINLECGLKPILNINFEKNNMSRKRILKTLSNSKLLNKKEDDK